MKRIFASLAFLVALQLSANAQKAPPKPHHAVAKKELKPVCAPPYYMPMFVYFGHQSGGPDLMLYKDYDEKNHRLCIFVHDRGTPPPVKPSYVAEHSILEGAFALNGRWYLTFLDMGDDKSWEDFMIEFDPRTRTFQRLPFIGFNTGSPRNINLEAGKATDWPDPAP
jgi:hypothetical protein